MNINELRTDHFWTADTITKGELKTSAAPSMELRNTAFDSALHSLKSDKYATVNEAV